MRYNTGFFPPPQGCLLEDLPVPAEPANVSLAIDGGVVGRFGVGFMVRHLDSELRFGFGLGLGFLA